MIYIVKHFTKRLETTLNHIIKQATEEQGTYRKLLIKYFF